MNDYLIQHRRLWYVRVQIPTDVRHLIGKTVFRKSTGTDSRKIARARAAPIVERVWREIERARATLRPTLDMRAEDLILQYKGLKGAEAERFALNDVVKFVLEQTGQSIADYHKELPTHGGLSFSPSSPQSDLMVSIIGRKTVFTKHVDEWLIQLGVAPKTRDEYKSAIRDFAGAVKQPLEELRGSHVQKWLNGLLANEDTQTVNKKLSGLRNYWGYLRSLELVDDDRKPFYGRVVRNAPDRVKVLKARYEPDDVVRLWRAAEGAGNSVLAAMIQIAAYSGSRREGIARLTVADIKTDPKTGVRFMHMSGKTEAGDRDVPIHSAIADLIDALIKTADRDGYLIHSHASNKNLIRATIVGREFGRLKTKLGFTEAHDFHSLRRTVAHLFESAECPEGIAQDIIGHKKLSLTYGLYSGKTRIDHRKQWLEKAIHYTV